MYTLDGMTCIPYFVILALELSIDNYLWKQHFQKYYNIFQDEPKWSQWIAKQIWNTSLVDTTELIIHLIIFSESFFTIWNPTTRLRIFWITRWEIVIRGVRKAYIQRLCVQDLLQMVGKLFKSIFEIFNRLIILLGACKIIV